MPDNTVTVIGNATRDPELRYLTSGTALCNLGVAVNRRYKKGDEYVEDVSFFDVVCWRDLADNVAESIGKGDRVIVVGRLEQRSWENSEGEKRSKVEITADSVGPDLRWATASPTRQAKSESSGGGAPARSDDNTPPDDSYESF